MIRGELILIEQLSDFVLDKFTVWYNSIMIKYKGMAKLYFLVLKAESSSTELQKAESSSTEGRVSLEEVEKM